MDVEGLGGPKHVPKPVRPNSPDRRNINHTPQVKKEVDKSPDSVNIDRKAVADAEAVQAKKDAETQQVIDEVKATIVTFLAHVENGGLNLVEKSGRLDYRSTPAKGISVD